jgi:hypothetical protein
LSPYEADALLYLDLALPILDLSTPATVRHAAVPPIHWLLEQQSDQAVVQGPLRRGIDGRDVVEGAKTEVVQEENACSWRRRSRGVANSSLTFTRRSRRLHSSRVRSDLEIPPNPSTVLLDVEKEKLSGDENTFTYENNIWGRYTMHTNSTVHTAKSSRQEEMNHCMFGSHVPPSHPSPRTTFFRAYRTLHSPTGKLRGRGLSQRQREGEKKEEQGDGETERG